MGGAHALMASSKSNQCKVQVRLPKPKGQVLRAADVSLIPHHWGSCTKQTHSMCSMALVACCARHHERHYGTTTCVGQLKQPRVLWVWLLQ